jgi:hypothetical protein
MVHVASSEQCMQWKCWVTNRLLLLSPFIELLVVSFSSPHCPAFIQETLEKIAAIKEEKKRK